MDLNNRSASSGGLLTIRLYVIFIGILFSLTSCDLSPQMKRELEPLMNQWGKLMSAVLGESEPRASSSPVARSSVAPGEEEFISIAAKNAKANAEILKEILLVVYNREPKDQGDFGNWVDTLNQGASIEGVYNGLTHSAEYRKLESSSGSASVEALQVFSTELALLEIELEKPTLFDSVTASPLPQAQNQEGSGTLGIDLARQNPLPGQSPLISEAEKNFRILSEKYSKQFVGLSIFTLKRVAADEALKVIASKSTYKEKLALWYSKWAVHMSNRNVDFGLALRNKPDEAFHFKWAVMSSDDRIKWEVLNRIHRLLNEANRHKQ